MHKIGFDPDCYYPSQWDFNVISEHPELKTESFRLYKHAPWDLHKLSHRPNFQLEWILEIDYYNHNKDYYPSQWDFDVI